MRAGLSTISWILILAVASQGALPGVVVCIEPTGQVQVETISDRCCRGEAISFVEAAAPAVTSDRPSETADPCGPCTDSPISLIPVVKPSKRVDTADGAPSSFILEFTPPAASMAAHPSVTTDAAFIPVNTTILLI